MEKELRQSRISRSDNWKCTPHPKSIYGKAGFQCGFCTPGIIIQRKRFLMKILDDRREVREALSGNICRCTGYVKIFESVSAAAKMIKLEEND